MLSIQQNCNRLGFTVVSPLQMVAKQAKKANEAR